MELFALHAPPAPPSVGGSQIRTANNRRPITTGDEIHVPGIHDNRGDMERNGTTPGGAATMDISEEAAAQQTQTDDGWGQKRPAFGDLGQGGEHKHNGQLPATFLATEAYPNKRGMHRGNRAETLPVSVDPSGFTSAGGVS